MDWLIFFGLVLKSALFSTGGLGPLPSLHNDFTARGWAGEKQFTEAISIGQVTPGPNGLWVVSLGYLVAGWPGAALASLALLLPPLTVLIVQKCYDRIAHHPATQGLLDGVVLAITGFNLIVLTRIFWSTGLDIWLVALAVISAVLALSRRVSVNTILILAALIGLIIK